MSDWIDRLAGIDLADAVADVALLDRVDRKYIVRRDEVARAVDRLDGEGRVLDIDGERRFGYLTVYYDTPTGDLLLAAARRRPRRAKVRTRTYLATGTSFFEVKSRQRTGRATKQRWERAGDPLCLHDDELAILAGYDEIAPLTAELAPAIVTEYIRTTLVVGTQRATIDAGLFTGPVRNVGWDGVGWDGVGCAAGCGVGEHVIVETKSPDRRPGPLDRALWSLGHRPQRFSKYAVGAVCARPELPANPWHRAIRRYVTDR